MIFEKVITAQEMKRLERLAIEQGQTEETLMLQGGGAVATHLDHWVRKKKITKKVTLLAGKGNNGGDGFVAALELLEKGYSVRAFLFFPFSGCRPLCQKFAKQFQQEGGHLQEVEQLDRDLLGRDGVILDALFGSGVRGGLEKRIETSIICVNRCSLPVIALDVPSGLDPSTGNMSGHAIEADVTLTLGFLKKGFFIEQGWNCVGKIEVIEFGLPSNCVADAQPDGWVYREKNLSSLLPKIVRNRHKYQAGLVVGYAGSCGMTGAAKLASLAALSSGAGIVKLFVPSKEVQKEMGDRPYEVISHPWEESFAEVLEKASSIFVGPGLANGREVEEWIKQWVSQLKCPCVFDADALCFLREVEIPFLCLLTPHRGEMIKLLGVSSMSEKNLHGACQRFCEEKNIILILKGAPTAIFSPEINHPIFIPQGDPGMATAGTGDVLTGILAALLAQGCSPLSAAILGCSLHGIAGEIAARKRTSYSCIATDVIEAFPHAFRFIKNNYR